MKLHSVLLVACGLMLAVCATSQRSVMQRTEQVAASHGCVPLDEGEDSVVEMAAAAGGVGDLAFLCRAPGAEGKILLLVDAATANSPWHACGPRVPLPAGFEPDGLSVVEPGAPDPFTQASLSAWKDAARNPGPVGVVPSAPILDTARGVAGWAFYCHESRWLRVFVH